MDPDPSGTDAALVSALAYVMIKEDLVDKPFLDKYCVGYDETTMPAGAPANGHYKAYILGEGPDGVAKTSEGSQNHRYSGGADCETGAGNRYCQTGVYHSGLRPAAPLKRRNRIPCHCHALYSDR